MLPNVKIDFANGAIGASEPMDDGVTGLVCTAVAVTQTVNGKTENVFALNTPYLITKLDELVSKGITSDSSDSNATLYKAVKEFYDEAPDGSKLWIMGVADTVTIADIVDKTKDNAKKLLVAANGTIRTLAVKIKDKSAYTPTVTTGIDGTVRTAITNAQALAEWATETLFAPVMVLLEGRHYTGNAETLVSNPVNTGNNNRVGVVIGDTVADSKGAAVGLLAGRIASIPVQRSVARVRTGSIVATTMYIGGVAAELGNPETINDCGFICPRTFVGKGGYFWSDDKLAAEASDDYSLIPRRRVADKAYRITYSTLINEVAEEISVTDDGKISAPVVKAIQTAVESAIVNNMTSRGNLGNDPSDPNDMGVECYINPDQNIVATSRLDVQVRIKPHGYSKYINVSLGFKVTQ
ncbi:MAG: DUF2586 family protein [Bacteroidales bacterium]|nr:DUF2586 family protein [Bacteroidales bacterium]